MDILANIRIFYVMRRAFLVQKCERYEKGMELVRKVLAKSDLGKNL